MKRTPGELGEPYYPSPTLGRADVPARRRLSLANLPFVIGEALWSIVVGHWVTWRNFWRRKVTDQYPHRDPERNWKPRPGYRGDFALITDKEKGRLRCVACMQCANICPSRCIHIKGEGRGPERHPVEFFVDVGLCQYCWLCVEVCPMGALTMTYDYETAADSPRKLIRDLEYLQTRGLEFDDVLRPEGRAGGQASQAAE
jgi:formate hydrogenlyase subunit 6/NADH:ubiquinone oxidoreductase subunit I